MKIIKSFEKNNLASVYIAELEKDKFVEFVESVQPPLTIDEKWVLIVSVLFGCPVRCKMCDAGGDYKGKLSVEQLMEQIKFLISRKFEDFRVPSKKFKIQFARLGEPALNPAVLEILEKLPNEIDAPGLIPCISTIAPLGSENFFSQLKLIKDKYYDKGRFQLQFSIHSTDEKIRDEIIPVKKLSFMEIAEISRGFRKQGDRKVTLNFALAKEYPLNPDILLENFSVDDFLIKITPLNPTYTVQKNNLESYISTEKITIDDEYPIINELKSAGYEVILSIGELDENQIGSNCGQYILTHLRNEDSLQDSYQWVEKE
ncbi:MAG: radical SAM protein [Planctomycetes bacterium]|nr:radical SAM protein [Planctomycetota bacterium]